MPPPQPINIQYFCHGNNKDILLFVDMRLLKTFLKLFTTLANYAIACETFITFTDKRTICISAGRISMTIICSSSTFVNIYRIRKISYTTNHSYKNAEIRGITMEGLGFRTRNFPLGQILQFFQN